MHTYFTLYIRICPQWLSGQRRLWSNVSGHHRQKESPLTKNVPRELVGTYKTSKRRTSSEQYSRSRFLSEVYLGTRYGRWCQHLSCREISYLLHICIRSDLICAWTRLSCEFGTHIYLLTLLGVGVGGELASLRTRFQRYWGCPHCV